MGTRNLRPVSLLAGIVVAGTSLALLQPVSSYAADRPAVTEPRCTSGDAAVEPDWADRLTITVGPDRADLVGTTDRAIQAAVDYVSRLGGGTVRVLPGTYRLRNAVYLQPRLRLIGAGAESILIKEPSASTRLAADSDWYDQEITLADSAGFEVGDGVCLRARNVDTQARVVVKRTLVARRGDRFKLDRPLRENVWKLGDATASTLFPILSGENVSDVRIENLVLDGNRPANDPLDGNHAGCIFLQDCSRITVRGVTAKNYNGDGISWQVCHDVIVEDCVIASNAGLGLHPGSGSQRPVIRRNRVEGNDIGLFFCWGVKFALAERNTLAENRIGISIGHRDTDNLITHNEILRSRETGLLFRPERGKDFAGHRNRIEHNRIVDSGAERGAAIDIQGETESIRLLDNELVESRAAAGRAGIRLGARTSDIQLRNNRFEGFAEEVQRMKP